MSLAPGMRLGPYEIVAPLGAGGMGEVWRARDPQLGREVALKVLPDTLAHDAERLGRFEREAKLLAQLNHPNIAHVYGLETNPSDGTRALVMELVEGPTLADRLEAGAFSPAESLSVSLQIALALEEAHEKGIVHRDLKPQNIKASIEGKVKVLDFGLAKAMDPMGAASGGAIGSALAQSPTLTLGATIQGVILGTAAYMAPEQAKGMAVDKRADIWAFGVVLFEMLTGRRLFAGDSVPETLAGVLKTEIDLGALPAETPPAIRALVGRCLQRDPRRRLRDIGEARLVLEQPLEHEARAVPEARGLAFRERLAWAALALVLAAAGWGAARFAAAPAATRTPARFQIPPPEGMRYEGFGGTATPSPDGRRFAFRIDAGPIAVRRLDTLETTRLPGTERSYEPSFSPDGKELVYFSTASLARIDAGGLQPPQPLAPVEDGRGASWGRGGDILFAPGPGRGLLRIDARGGEATEVTALDAGREEIAHVRPSFLPDGRHFLYLVKSQRPEHAGIYVGSLDGSVKRRVLPVTVAARYAEPGYVLYLQDQALVARPFDPRRLEVTGEAVVLARGIDYEPEFDIAPFATSETGLLLYHPAAPAQQRRLAWFDRAGAQLALVGESGDFNIDLDPAGTRLAVVRVDEAARRPDIWVRDLVRGTGARLTSDAPAIGPVWSPDGKRIAYVVLRGSERELVVQPAAGGTEQRLWADRFVQEPIDWSPDGRWLLVEVYAPGEEVNLTLVPADGGGSPVTFAGTRHNEHTGRFSPDGRWIAYVSRESGDEEVYVQPVPPTGAKHLVSTAGGGAPRWRGDGRELYYVQPDERGDERTLMAVDVTAGADLGLGQPRALYRGATFDYEPAPDGQRFLVGNPLGEDAPDLPIEVIVDFPALVERR